MELRAGIMVDISDDTKDGGYRRIELLTGPGRRRKWSDDDKARIVEAALQPVPITRTLAIAVPQPLNVSQGPTMRSRNRGR